MNLFELIKQLQHKPYQTRLRILWGSVAVAAIILISLWGYSIKHRFDNNSSQENTTVLPTIEQKYVKIERVETVPSGLKIFFTVNNQTTNILNFSGPNEIKLAIEGKTVNPSGVFDRQSKPFVQKILSKTENFGTLVFSGVQADVATLSFEDLYFEHQPEKIFMESHDLDLEELKTKQELRK